MNTSSDLAGNNAGPAQSPCADAFRSEVCIHADGTQHGVDDETGQAASATEAAYDVIVEVRDAFPRVADDVDSWVIAEAVIDRLLRAGYLTAPVPSA